MCNQITDVLKGGTHDGSGESSHRNVALPGT